MHFFYFLFVFVCRFIECSQNGQANVLTCPSQLIWDESRLSCVYTFTGVVTPSPASIPGTGVGK